MTLSRIAWFWLIRLFRFGVLVVSVLHLALPQPRTVMAELYGPPTMDPNARHSPTNVGIEKLRPVWVSRTSEHEGRLETIERVSGEEDGPRVPEPMVFDLIRPLGARRGEAELNVLGLVPLSRKSRTVDDVPDPLGLVRRSPDTQTIEWAPEFEIAVRDGLAFEVEFPFENSRLEAYKGAAQLTFGTTMNNRLIHGAQTILQYDVDPRVWTTTWLYLAGFRFNDTWSLFSMLGPRFEIGDAVGGANTEILANVTLFADITDRLVGGIETNFGQVIDGEAALLVMPQLHYEVSKYWMIQAGAGVRFTQDFALPEIGFRLIREF
jgi:hypothetical protein